MSPLKEIKWRRSLFFTILLFFPVCSLYAQLGKESDTSARFPEDTVIFREGEVFLSRGEAERALWRFKKLVTHFPESPLRNEAKFRMAICYTRLKRPKDAIRTLNELFSTFLAPPRMVAVLTMMGDNYLEMNEPMEALRWYGKGLLVPHPEKQALRQKIRALIDGLDDEERLKEIESNYRGAYAGAYAKLKLAQIAKHRGNETLSRRLFSELKKEYRFSEDGLLFEEIPPAPSQQAGQRYLVGAILPLSGKYKVYGEKILKATELALRENRSSESSPNISLLVRDSKGESREIDKAVEELASKHKAIAILGIPLSSNVDGAARKCQKLKVPLLTLSQKESIPGKGEMVFQCSVRPSAQMATLIAHISKDLKNKTFAILFPNSPYGNYFRELFVRMVTERGGKVIGSIAYQEGQTDFSDEIGALLKLKSGQGSVSEKGIDGIFIPDSYNRAGLILAQLDYHNVRLSWVLGTSAWNHPELIAIAGRAAEHAVFVDAFSSSWHSEAVASFVKKFQDAYSHLPDTLDALAYEEADFLRRILTTGSISLPTQLRDEILRFHGYRGVCGLRGFTQSGDPIRTLLILRVRNGRIVPTSSE